MANKITVFDQLKTSMARAKGWASNQAAQVAQAAAEAMEEMDGVKADKSEGVAVVIPTTGWSQDSGAYPYYYDIAADGVTAKDRADLALAPASIAAGMDRNGWPARATTAPTARFSGRIRPDEKTFPGVPAEKIVSSPFAPQKNE